MYGRGRMPWKDICERSGIDSYARSLEPVQRYADMCQLEGRRMSTVESMSSSGTTLYCRPATTHM